MHVLYIQTLFSIIVLIHSVIYNDAFETIHNNAVETVCGNAVTALP